MTALRYFIPLVKYSNTLNIKSRFFVKASNKYNCPLARQNLESLKALSIKYNISLIVQDYNSVIKTSGTFFIIETVGLDDINKNLDTTIISITYMGDYTSTEAEKYKRADYVLVNSEKISKFYNKDMKKSIYFGDLKYDITFQKKEDILKKYSLVNNEKYALVVYPRLRDINKIDIIKLYSVISSLGYKILVKTRGKDKAHPDHQGDYYFQDTSWYPHDTMELLKISDVMINFDSSAIEEAIRLKVPTINFHIKPFRAPLCFLYDNEAVFKFGNEVDFIKIKNALEYINENKNKIYNTLEKVDKEYYHCSKNASKEMISFLLSKNLIF